MKDKPQFKRQWLLSSNRKREVKTLKNLIRIIPITNQGTIRASRIQIWRVHIKWRESRWWDRVQCSLPRRWAAMRSRRHFTRTSWTTWRRATNDWTSTSTISRRTSSSQSKPPTASTLPGQFSIRTTRRTPATHITTAALSVLTLTNWWTFLQKVKDRIMKICKSSNLNNLINKHTTTKECQHNNNYIILSLFSSSL